MTQLIQERVPVRASCLRALYFCGTTASKASAYGAQHKPNNVAVSLLFRNHLFLTDVTTDIRLFMGVVTFLLRHALFLILFGFHIPHAAD